MAVPLPQYDSVLMREHLFRDTNQLEAVLSKDTDTFRPVKEVGLGLFNYRLVNIDSVSESEGLQSTSFRDIMARALKFTQATIIDTILFVLIVSLILLLFSWLYPKVNFKKKGFSKQESVDLENQYSSSSISAESTQFEKAQYCTQSPASSLLNTEDSLSCFMSSAYNAPVTPTSSSVEKFRTPKTPVGMGGMNNYTRLPETVDSKLLMNRLRID